jgi:hypothetical protein
MKGSGLYDKIEKIYYGVVTGNNNPVYNINDDKYKKIGSWIEGHEMLTLSHLYSFCKSNPSYKVLYYHTKGSLNYDSTANVKFRHVLNAFTLHPGCIDALNQGYDICGFRLSPLPYIHYSGNFWWAQCKYINTLIDPGLMHHDSQLQQLGEKIYYPMFKGPYMGCMGFDRFFAETWIGTAPYVNGADCINSSYNAPYMFGHAQNADVLLAANRIMENPSLNRDIMCGQALINDTRYISDFYEPFQQNLHYFQCAKIESLVLRSILLYKSLPFSLLDWRERLQENMSNATESTIKKSIHTIRNAMVDMKLDPIDKDYDYGANTYFHSKNKH